MRSQLLFAVIFGFLAGVFARSFYQLGLAVAGFAALFAATAVFLIFIDTTKRRSLVIVAIALAAFAGGIIRMNGAVLVGDPALTGLLDTQVTVSGIVSAEPDARETGTRISVRADELLAASPVRSLARASAPEGLLGQATSNGASSSIPIHAGILALAPPHTNISYGDRVRVSGTLRLPQAFDTGEGRQFSYPEYLAKDGIGYQLAFAHIEKSDKNEGNILKAAAIRAKQLYLQGEDSVLPEPEAGLAGGITVGDKRSIGPELTNVFQRVSLVHMIVLSGYNITVVMNSVRWFLQFAPRYLQYGGIFSTVLFFVLMSGGAASAVRAGAMALIAVFARATGRIFLAGRIVAVVAFAMVLWNPFTLAFDPSFQLSTLATLGLIAFTPIFAERLKRIPEKYGLREIASSTLATQFAVLPLLLYQNGQLSLVALPANLLALVPVPLAMLASFIAAIGGMIFGSHAVLLGLPAYILLSYIITIAKIFASLPFASLAVGAFSVWWMFLAYAAMFGGFVFIKKRTG